MASNKMSATEAWVRLEAPELLEGPLGKAVEKFIQTDDLNGLAHFLERRLEKDAAERVEEARLADRETPEDTRLFDAIMEENRELDKFLETHDIEDLLDRLEKELPVDEEQKRQQTQHEDKEAANRIKEAMADQKKFDAVMEENKRLNALENAAKLAKQEERKAQTKEQEQEKLAAEKYAAHKAEEKKEEPSQTQKEKEAPKPPDPAATWEKLKAETDVSQQIKGATEEQKQQMKWQEKDPGHVHGNEYIATLKNQAHAKMTDLKQHSVPAMTTEQKAEMRQSLARSEQALTTIQKQEQKSEQTPQQEQGTKQSPPKQAAPTQTAPKQTGGKQTASKQIPPPPPPPTPKIKP